MSYTDRTLADELPPKVSGRLNAIDAQVRRGELLVDRIDDDRWVIRVEGSTDETSEEDVGKRHDICKKIMSSLEPVHEGLWYGTENRPNTWQIRFDIVEPPK